MVNSESTKLDILAIAAHRDDVEITCGGTIIKMVDNGKKAGILDLTQGEMGTKGTAEDREREADDAAKIIGLSFRRNLKLPDSAVEVNRENKLKIARVIRDTQPELVILPFWMQRHPDHLYAMQLGYDACYLAGLKKLGIDGNGEPFRPRKIIYASSFRDVRHSFYVDITDQFDRKLEAVRAYKSQFDGSQQSKEIFKPGVDIFTYMSVSAMHYGHQVGVKYAEAFTVKENILIDDPLSMPVKSI
ncbi:MAG: bacillithiol biosynthesis deacetylase BshB1 [candidate division Zixibacteria bacterium]|nr:bacillithiol biosynthesis deacetylase BshB1 [candidate division Zixibacteria bacterium]